MIFATVGSHPTFRFQRLLNALGRLSVDALVVQYGPGEPPEGAAEAYRWLPFPRMLDFMKQADTVISHAGVGTILCAHEMGHTPIVAPRMKRFNETVDDHQVELSRMLERTGQVLVAWDLEDLPRLASITADRSASASLHRQNLVATLHDALRQ